MTTGALIGFVNLLCVGLLAGEEFVIRYGVRKPIASLDMTPHIEVRQALIYRLRILVPAIFGAAILSGIAVAIIGGFEHGFAFHWAGVLALVAFIGVTLGGTVPINEAVIAWEPAAPPSNWQAVIARWEQLDTVRCWLAFLAFAFFVAALFF